MAVESHHNSRRVAGVAAGLVVAVLGVVGVFVAGSRNQAAPPGNSTNKVGVVVVRTDVGRLTRLSASSLSIEKRPAAELTAGGYYSSFDQVTGKFSAVDLKSETVLQPSLLVTTPALAAGVAATAPLTIRDNYVAMAIPVDDQKGVGGFIQPDDHIDILIDSTGNGSLRYMLQDVHVLKVGQAAQQGAPGGAANLLVIEVGRGQAEALSFLIEGKGTAARVVKYVLRPVSQYGKLDAAPRYLSSGDSAAPAADDPPLTPQRFQSLFPG